MPLNAAWKDAAAPDIGRKAETSALVDRVRRMCNNAMTALFRSAASAGANSKAALHAAKRAEFGRVVYDVSLNFDQTERSRALPGGNTDAEDVYFALMAMYDAVFNAVAAMRGTPAVFVPHGTWETDGPETLRNKVDEFVAALVEGGVVGKATSFTSRAASVGRALGISVSYDAKVRALMRALGALVSPVSLVSRLVARLDTELSERELANVRPLAPLFEALAPDVLRLALYSNTPSLGSAVVAVGASAGKAAGEICGRLIDVAFIEKQKTGARPPPSDDAPAKRSRVEPGVPSSVDEVPFPLVTGSRNRFIDYNELVQKTRVNLTMIGPDATGELTEVQLNAFSALGSDIDLRAYVQETTELTRRIVRWVAEGNDARKIDDMVTAYAAANREYRESPDRNFEDAKFTFIGLLRMHTAALLSSGLIAATVALIDNNVVDKHALRMIGSAFTYQTFDVFGQLLADARQRPALKRVLEDLHTDLNSRLDTITDEFDVTYTTPFSDIGDAFFTANRGMDGAIRTFVERLLIVRANDAADMEWKEFAEKSADEFVAHMVQLVREIGAAGVRKLSRGSADINVALRGLDQFE